MYQGNVCRLCVETCEEYKSLYDESDNATEVHQLMIQYFDAKLFAGNKFNVMCMKCWHQISDFNSFQNSIYRAQKVLNIKEEEIDIKLEEEFLPDYNFARSCNELTNECNNFGGEIYPSSYGGSINTEDNVEYDDTVGESPSGGEFKNVDNSRELPATTALNAECYESSKIKEIPKRLITEKLLTVKASDDLIAQGTPVLKCLYCTETSSTYSLLISHFQDKHPLLKCVVKCCRQYYSQREKFEDHIRRQHIDSNPFACTVCGKQLVCRRTLTLHMRVHHPSSIDATVIPKDDSNIVPLSSEKVTEMSMKSVPKLFGEYANRKKYIKKSDDFIAKLKPILKCDLCHEKYLKYSLLQQHFTESHHKKKCYITCCQKKFGTRSYILDHLQLHVNPDVYKCELCEKRLGSRYQLRTHLYKRHSSSIAKNTNTSAKKNVSDKAEELVAKCLPKIKCSVCKKEFVALAILQCHFLACHPNEEFHVECCQQKFRTPHEIEAHERYHGEPTDFKCDLCCVYYNNDTALEEHMRIAH